MRWLPATLIALMLASSGAFAASGNYSSDVDLDPIMALIENGDFDGAINELYAVLDLDPDNPDILSLLGFTHRKKGEFEDALTYYEWALRSEPEHKGANEYLGELYLQTNQLDKAVRQLEILDGLCGNGCKEYTKLKKLIDSYEEQTASSS